MQRVPKAKMKIPAVLFPAISLVLATSASSNLLGQADSYLSRLVVRGAEGDLIAAKK
jgi:hypothetical protein